MKHILIVLGVAGFLLALAPAIVALIPFVLGVLGAVFCLFGTAWIVKRCWDIATHDVWKDPHRRPR